MRRIPSSVADAAVISVLFAASSVLVPPSAAVVLTGIATNLVSRITDDGLLRYKEHFLSEKGVLNHDIQFAAQRAYVNALAHIELLWKQSHGRDRGAGASGGPPVREIFQMLREDAIHVLEQSHLAALAADPGAIQRYRGNDVDVRRSVREQLRSYLQDHDEELVRFIESQLVSQVAFFFVEELKKGDEQNSKAWRAYQLLLHDSLRVHGAETLARLDNMMESVERLDAWASKIEALPDGERDTALDAALNDLSAGLITAIAGEARLTRDAVQESSALILSDIAALHSRIGSLSEAIDQILAILTSQRHSTTTAGASVATDWVTRLPAPRCREVVGRGRLSEKVTATFFSPEPRRVVSFVAFGGYGKTEAARCIAKQLLEEKRFTDLAWVSLQTVGFVLPGKTSDVKATVDPSRPENIVAGIMDQLNTPTEKALATRVRNEPVLIVVDNLESLPSEAEIAVLLRDLNDILGDGPSRVILTTRVDAYAPYIETVELAGLSRDETTKFLRDEAGHLAISALLNAPDGVLREIHELTDGMPLALHLTVGQCRSSDVSRVVRRLREARAQVSIKELCTYLYRQAWAELSPPARGLLVYFGAATATSQGPEQLVGMPLRDGIVLDEDAVDDATEELWRWRVVQRVEATELGSPDRSAVHPLARSFVLDPDVRAQWEEIVHFSSLMEWAKERHGALIDRVVRRQVAREQFDDRELAVLERAIRDMLRAMDVFLELGQPRAVLEYWAWLNGYLWLKGRFGDGLHCQSRALAAAKAMSETDPDGSRSLQAAIHANLAFVNMELGRYAESDEHGKQAEALFLELEDYCDAADVRRYRANVRCRTSFRSPGAQYDLEEAKRLLTDARAMLGRASDSAHSQSWTYRQELGEILPHRGMQVEPPAGHFINSPAGRKELAGEKISSLFGWIHRTERDFDAALRELSQALVANRRLRTSRSDYPALGVFLTMARVHEERAKQSDKPQDWRRAKAYFRWCVDLTKGGSHPPIRAEGLFGLARLMHREGDLDKAHEYALQAEQLHDEMGKMRERNAARAFLKRLEQEQAV